MLCYRLSDYSWIYTRLMNVNAPIISVTIFLLPPPLVIEPWQEVMQVVANYRYTCIFHPHSPPNKDASSMSLFKIPNTFFEQTRCPLNVGAVDAQSKFINFVTGVPVCVYFHLVGVCLQKVTTRCQQKWLTTVVVSEFRQTSHDCLRQTKIKQL